jgi:hypothetical protein
VDEKGVASNQRGRYEHERATADPLFKEGERLRISVEAPRIDDNYIYVIDREVCKDKSEEILREPDLIFPAVVFQIKCRSFSYLLMKSISSASKLRQWRFWRTEICAAKDPEIQQNI